jgi:Zn finger protein HypA/HybF involved in hydrogenase expression
VSAFEWQRACRDCRNVWGLEYADDGNTVANETDCICPDCGSDAVEPLAVAQRRAELAAEAPAARADYMRDLARDEGVR